MIFLFKRLSFFKWIFIFILSFYFNCCTHTKSKNLDSQLSLFYYSAKKEKMNVYLLGSMHVVRESDLALLQPLMTQFIASDALALEIPIMSENGRFLRAFSNWVEKTPDDFQAKNFYKENVWKEISLLSKTLELPTTSFAQLHANLILQAIVLAKAKKLGYKGPGIDGYFEELAIKKSKKIIGLESFDDQLSILFSKPSNLNLHELKEFDINFENEFIKLANTWRSGNEKEMVKLMKSSRDPFSKTLEDFAMDPKRNKKMSEKIIMENKQYNSLFVVVGAAHLLGKGSILKHLESEGYELNRLDPLK